MTALTDEEIRAALPVASRQKIDSAFEALSQSLPSDKEKMILYRVAHTLKLNPTDTHFSVMAALHYYLQLYQAIPDKIIKASDVEVGKHIQNLKGVAEREMTIARDRVIGELAQNVGDIAQQVAGNAAAAEKGKAIAMAAKWTASAVLASAIVFGGTGYAIRMIYDKLEVDSSREQVNAANTRADSAEKGMAENNISFFNGCNSDSLKIETVDGKRYCTVIQPTAWEAFRGTGKIIKWRIP